MNCAKGFIHRTANPARVEELFSQTQKRWLETNIRKNQEGMEQKPQNKNKDIIGVRRETAH